MLVIGATTAFFMGLLGVVNNDIKRVIAYSTLSQLGYMTVALGVSAYSAAIFHLMTHAFFKALLFLAAGSVIIAMHHEQDMRKMGGLAQVHADHLRSPADRRAGADRHAVLLRLLFQGRDHRGGAAPRTAAARGYAYWCVLLGVFVTALYTFRMLFMTFHGQERFRDATHAGSDAIMPTHGHRLGDPHESPGWSRCRWSRWRSLAAHRLPHRRAGAVRRLLRQLDLRARQPTTSSASSAREWHGPLQFGAAAACCRLPFWLALAGVLHRLGVRPAAAAAGADAARSASLAVPLLVNKYYFDWFNENVSCPLTRGHRRRPVAGRRPGAHRRRAWSTARPRRSAGSAASLRRVQSGYLYSYAFWMMIGLALLLGWFLARAEAKGSHMHARSAVDPDLAAHRRRRRWCWLLGDARASSPARWLALAGLAR